jgi:gamma-glutamylcyclotransferase (GGCT)/AIG2-like uncharacterized protein YtfP
MRDRFLYFAYGSNMCTRRLRQRAPSAVPLATGCVSGYTLAFDKVSTDGSGKCNIVANGKDENRVYGVLYDVASAEASALDKAEGLGAGYFKTVIAVMTEAGERMAETYIADRTSSRLTPYDWYKDLVVRGALEHGLPAAYVRGLQVAASQPDPDEKRAERNKAIIGDL